MERTKSGGRYNATHIQKNYAAFYAKMNEYFETEKHTDVKIICGDRQFKCHRLILAAASEYFDGMFGGNFKETSDASVTLHHVDGDIFEELLRFMYKGDIEYDLIDDENVYDLLYASDMFGLKFVENRCIHYLTCRRIPVQRAIDIFSFAYATHKYALLLSVGQFILEHIDTFSRTKAFLTVARDELEALLSFFSCTDHSFSSEATLELLDAIYRWVRMSLSASDLEDKKSEFVDLTKRVQPFQDVSAEYIAGYFDKIVIDERFDVDSVDAVSDVELKIPRLSLHAYIRTDEIEKKVGLHTRKYESNLFTLQRNEHRVEWLPTLARRSNKDKYIEKMRTVKLNGKFFCLKYWRYYAKLGYVTEPLLEFDVRDTLDLTAGLQSLKVEQRLGRVPNQPMCCGGNNIYFSPVPAMGYDTEVHYYNCERDQWFTLTHHSPSFPLGPMTWCDGRLYFIRNDVLTYDPRAGNFEKLPRTCNFSHGQHNEATVHKGKIYVTGTKDKWIASPYAPREYFENQIEVYDPAAGVWTDIVSNYQCSKDVNSLRLVSYDSQLWLFWCTFIKSALVVHTYDSYTQEWNVTSGNYESQPPQDPLNRAVMSKIYSDCDLNERDSCYKYLQDVIIS